MHDWRNDSRRDLPAYGRRISVTQSHGKTLRDSRPRFSLGVTDKKPFGHSSHAGVGAKTHGIDHIEEQLRQVKQARKSIQAKQEYLKRLLHRYQSLETDQMDDTSRSQLALLHKKMMELNERKQGLVLEEQYLTRTHKLLCDEQQKQQPQQQHQNQQHRHVQHRSSGGRRQVLPGNQQSGEIELERDEVACAREVLREMSEDDLYQYLSHLANDMRRQEQAYAHKQTPEARRSIQELQEKITETIALLLVRLQPELSAPQLYLIAQQKVQGLLRHLDDVVGYDEPPMTPETQHLVHDVEAQLLQLLRTMHAQIRREQQQYNADCFPRVQKEMYQKAQDIGGLLREGERLLEEQDQQPERRWQKRKRKGVQRVQMVVAQQLTQLMKQYELLQQQAQKQRQLQLRIQNVFAKLDRHLQVQEEHFRSERATGIHELEKDALPLLQQLFHQQRAMSGRSEYKADTRLLLAHSQTALRNHQVAITSSPDTIDPSVLIQSQREIQQMLMRAQEQLLLEPEEELPDEADVEGSIVDGATDNADVRVDVTEDGLAAGSGQLDKTDESAIEELIRRLTHGPLAKLDDDSELAVSTQSDTELQSSRVQLTTRNQTLDKNYFSKAPLWRPRAPSVHQNPPPVAHRKTMPSDGKPKTRPERDGGKDTAHSDKVGLRIQVADKKRPSAAPKDNNDHEVEIPLRRKRATTHLFFEAIRRTSLTSSKGKGSRGTLSAHTIATHLASEFSLTPMSFDSLQPSYQSLGGFWPKPQRYYTLSNMEHCGESTRGEHTGRAHGESTRGEHTGRAHGESTRGEHTGRAHGESTRGEHTGRAHGESTRGEHTGRAHGEGTRGGHTGRAHGEGTRGEHTGRAHGESTRGEHTGRAHGESTRGEHTGRAHGESTRGEHTGRAHRFFTFRRVLR